MSYKTQLQTYTGNVFDIAEPCVEDVEIKDIAHALSQINRFTGHTNIPYSVAEHSVRVSKLVPDEYALEALLHDASEAYIADMATPVKRTVNMEGYLQLEKSIQTVCEIAFGVVSTAESHIIIKEADMIMLKVEALTFLKLPLIGAWRQYIEDIEIPKGFNEYPHGWSPKTAEKAFMARFVELTYGTRNSII